MSVSSRLLRASSRHLRIVCHPSLSQAHAYDGPLFRLNSGSVRHMGIFREFSQRLRGEFNNNAELKKSVGEFKEKAVNFKVRTKVATEKICDQVKGAEASARQVSAVVKDKVNAAKERISEATAQAKESISRLKGKSAKGSHGLSDESKGASDAGRSESSGNGGPLTGNADWLSRGLQRLSFSASAFLDKVKRANVVFVDKVMAAKVSGLMRKGYSLFIEELTVTSSKRRIKASYAATSTTERSTSTALAPVVKKQTGWEKRWDQWKDKVRAHPVYKRVRGIKEHPIVAKSHEIAEDVRERWETSDSPVVHKIQDLNDSLFGETATAVAVKEIRQRDPLFSFPDFLVEVQESTRPVLQAYLKGDLKELQKRCSREVVDRCRAERTAYESQGIFMDSKLLHISDVELRETKLMGNTPIIIVGFQTQQIYCVRDKYGKITQGSKDDIHTVFYAWAMQQVVPEDYQEGVFYPYWQLREMQQLGIQSII